MPVLAVVRAAVRRWQRTAQPGLSRSSPPIATVGAGTEARALRGSPWLARRAELKRCAAKAAREANPTPSAWLQ